MRIDGASPSGQALDTRLTRKPRTEPLSVEVLVPVLNEEETLRQNVEVLRDFRRAAGTFEWTITLGDNGSTDRTPLIGRELAASGPAVRYVRLEERGRGRALRRIWRESTADLVAYMDVDLSTDLANFPLLLDGLRAGYDMAIGSRLMQACRGHSQRSG